jgi:polyisoprenoid-binding protein YceI
MNKRTILGLTLTLSVLSACDKPSSDGDKATAKAAAAASAPALTSAAPTAFDPASAPDPAAYELDVAHSRVGFAVRHMMVSTTRGNFDKFGGTVFIDEKEPTKSKIDVEVEVASVDTREPKRDDHLRSPDFFDAKRFPKMTFKSTAVERAASGYKVTGDLTIKGTTKPVVLNVEPLSAEVVDSYANARRGTRATAKISRKEFGLAWDNKMANGVAVVGDEVTLELEIELVKKKPS